MRPARPADREGIASFTRDTFSWGDYVAEAFDEWLADPHGLVLVATDPADRPVAVARVTMLAPTEAWMHAARVHPDVRRSGLGMRLNDAGSDWARSRGAVVVRLLIEDWNEAARSQVAKLGYRPVAGTVHGRRSLVAAEADPRSNGGRRVPGEERLVVTRPSEAEPAWVLWSTGELAVASHHMWPVDGGWFWRRMRYEDLAGAAGERRLWQCPSGWVVGGLDDDGFAVTWICTVEDDAARLARSIVDRAADLGAESVSVKAPRVGWLSTGLEAAGFELVTAQVYERAL